MNLFVRGGRKRGLDGGSGDSRGTRESQAWTPTLPGLQRLTEEGEVEVWPWRWLTGMETKMKKKTKRPRRHPPMALISTLG
jgi:hypothetical protein